VGGVRELLTKDVLDGLDKWLKLNCYLAGAWVFVDLLPYIPPRIVERVIEGLLSKVGI
jgi:hypothetical protein